MSERAVAPTDWASELQSFSRQHRGWLITIVERDGDGTERVVVQERPLGDVRFEERRGIRILWDAPDRERREGALDVPEPQRLRIEQTAEGADRSLLVDGPDGRTTVVQFRSAMLPEMVDGVA